MKIAVMQPYFLPYIGYFQMFTAVDRYVIYDDCNYIKGGWIGRNRILCGDEVQYIRLLLQGASPNKRINEVGCLSDPVAREKSLRTVAYAYGKAPYFETGYRLLQKIYACSEENLSRFLRYSIEAVLEVLDLSVPLTFSSEFPAPDLHGADRIYDLCEKLGADTYLNAIGGRSLYREEDFDERGLRLGFLETGDIRYDQGRELFEPNLSILDLLMRCSPEELRTHLHNYRLITRAGDLLSE